jgi:hypothetical protein
MRISDITPETVEQILDAYPRLGFNQQITQLMVSQVKRKPQTAIFTWLTEVGRCCIHEFAPPSWNDMLNSSPFAE